jgi:hypothetical protein
MCARYQSVSKELIEKVIKVLEANRVMKLVTSL